MSENLPPNSSQPGLNGILSPRSLLTNLISSPRSSSPRFSLNNTAKRGQPRKSALMTDRTGTITFELEQPTSDPEESRESPASRRMGGMPTPPTSQSPPKPELHHSGGGTGTVKKTRNQSPGLSPLVPRPSTSQHSTPTTSYHLPPSSQSTSKRSHSRSASAVPPHLLPSFSQHDPSHLPLHSPQVLRVARSRSRSATPQPTPSLPISPWLSSKATSTTKKRGGRKSTPLKKVPSEVLENVYVPRASEEESEDPLLLKGGEELRGRNEGNPRDWSNRSRSRSVSHFSASGSGAKQRKMIQRSPFASSSGSGLKTGLGIVGAGISPGAKFDEVNRDWSPLRDQDSDDGGMDNDEDLGGFDWQNDNVDDTFAFKSGGGVGGMGETSQEMKVEEVTAQQQHTPPSTQPLLQDLDPQPLYPDTANPPPPELEEQPHPSPPSQHLLLPDHTEAQSQERPQIVSPALIPLTLTQILAAHEAQEKRSDELSPRSSDVEKRGEEAVKEEEVEEDLSDSVGEVIGELRREEQEGEGVEMAADVVEPLEEVAAEEAEAEVEVEEEEEKDEEEEGVKEQEEEKDEDEEDVPITSSLQAHRATPLKSRLSNPFLISTPPQSSQHSATSDPNSAGSSAHSSPYGPSQYHDELVPLAPISSSPVVPLHSLNNPPSSNRRSSTALNSSSPRVEWKPSSFLRRSVSTFGDDDDIDLAFRDPKTGEILGEGAEGVGAYDFGSLGDTTDESRDGDGEEEKGREGEEADSEENGEEEEEQGALLPPFEIVKKDLALPAPEAEIEQPPADEMQVSPVRPSRHSIEPAQTTEDIHMASPSPARPRHQAGPAPASPTPIRAHLFDLAPNSLERLRSIKRVGSGREMLEKLFVASASSQQSASRQSGTGRRLMRDSFGSEGETGEVRMVEREFMGKVLPELIKFGKRREAEDTSFNTEGSSFEDPSFDGGERTPVPSTSRLQLEATSSQLPPAPQSTTSSLSRRRRASHPTLPVIEVSSTDPQAAARAAAVLKTYHSYVQDGIVPEQSSDGEQFDEEEGQLLKEMLEEAQVDLLKHLGPRPLPSVAGTNSRSASPALVLPTPTSSLFANFDTSSQDRDATPVPSNTALPWTAKDWRRLEQALVDEIRRITEEGGKEKLRVKTVVASFLVNEGLTVDDLILEWTWEKLDLRVRALEERRARDKARKSMRASSTAAAAESTMVLTTLDVELSRVSDGSSSPLQPQPDVEEEPPRAVSVETSSSIPTLSSDDEREEEDDTFFERVRPIFPKPGPLPIKLEDDDDDYIVPPLALASSRFSHLYDEPIARPPLPSQIWTPPEDGEEESYEEEEEETFSREPSAAPSAAGKLFSYLGSIVRRGSASPAPEERPALPEMREINPSFSNTAQPFPILPSVLTLRTDRPIRPLPTPSESGSTSTSRRRRSSGEGKVWDQINELEDAESSREEERRSIEVLQSAGVKRKVAEETSMEELRRAAGPSGIPRIVYSKLQSPAMMPAGTRATDRPIKTKTFIGRKLGGWR